jgi:hypothetical protein
MSETTRDVDWYRQLSQLLHDDGPPEAVLALLEGDLNAPARPGSASTVLAAAIPTYTPETGIRVALALLRAGADPVNAGEAPSILVRALSSGLPELVRAVVDAGGAKGVKLTPPQRLMLAACRDDAAEVKRLLASKKLAPTAFKGNGNGPGHGFITPLVAAARGGYADVASALIAAGCPPTWGVGKWSGRAAPAAQAALFGHGELAKKIGGVSNEQLAWAAHAGGHLELARSFEPKIDALVRAAMERARPTPPPDLLGAWRADLARHRRPWPEWQELEAVAAEEWAQDGFLLTHASRELSIDRSPKSPANGHAWLTPLVGLRPSRARHGHPLFGLVDVGVVQRSSKSMWPELEHVDHIPSGGLALTSTAAGSPVLTRGDDVLVIQGRELVRVASLEIFVRYALHCALNGKDWLLDGLGRGFGRDRYELADLKLFD